MTFQIEEVALVTDKVTKKRRGFCFVTYISEDSVDKCTEQTFHNIEDTQVCQQLGADYSVLLYTVQCSPVSRHFRKGGVGYGKACDHIMTFKTILFLLKCIEGVHCVCLYRWK